MKNLFLVFTALAVVLLTPMAAQQDSLRVFIRAGEKTHGPAGNDEHDYPKFLAEWTKLLTERGASVQGALRFPTADELAKTDVLIVHKGDGGTCSLAERALLDTYTKRGGGLVVLHDGMCSDDAAWFSTVAGAAKQHGERNWSRGVLRMHIVDNAHPITKGLTDFEFNDEAFFKLTKGALQADQGARNAPAGHDGDAGGRRSRAADVGVREDCGRWKALSIVRLDAGALLQELLSAHVSGADSSRHCVGRKARRRSAAAEEVHVSLIVSGRPYEIEVFDTANRSGHCGRFRTVPGPGRAGERRAGALHGDRHQ
jgi:hypothetical protein